MLKKGVLFWNFREEYKIGEICNKCNDYELCY